MPDEIDAYDLACYLGLLEAENLPCSARNMIREKLLRAVRNSLVTDPRQ